MRVDGEGVDYPFTVQGIAARTSTQVAGQVAPAGYHYVLIGLQVRGLLTDRPIPAPSAFSYSMEWQTKKPCQWDDPYICSRLNPPDMGFFSDYYTPAVGQAPAAPDFGRSDVLIQPGQPANVILQTLMPDNDFELATARITPGMGTGMRADPGLTVPLAGLGTEMVTTT